jgi:hypothetical protein
MAYAHDNRQMTVQFGDFGANHFQAMMHDVNFRDDQLSVLGQSTIDGASQCDEKLAGHRLALAQRLAHRFSPRRCRCRCRHARLAQTELFSIKTVWRRTSGTSDPSIIIVVVIVVIDLFVRKRKKWFLFDRLHHWLTLDHLLKIFVSCEADTHVVATMVCLPKCRIDDRVRPRIRSSERVGFFQQDC